MNWTKQIFHRNPLPVPPKPTMESSKLSDFIARGSRILITPIKEFETMHQLLHDAERYYEAKETQVSKEVLSVLIQKINNYIDNCMQPINKDNFIPDIDVATYLEKDFK